MANRFVSPQQQFINNVGQPYAGGFLFFYVSGTSTPTPTYQDEALTIPNTNPVVLDSAGDAGNIFLDPGITYKVVLTDSNNNPIWTFDPVIPIDSSTSTGFNPVVSCNATGTNSITLTPINSSQQPAIYSNFQLFAFVPVATTTGPVTLQVGTLPFESVFVAPGVQAGSGTFVVGAGPYLIGYGSLVAGASPGFLLINQNIGAIQASLPLTMPQGYLTPTSGTPIIHADTSSNNIYYTPLIGLGAPIHNGVSIISTLLAGELRLLLSSSHVANNIYDVYLAYNGGSPVIGTGPTWAAGTSGSVTAGACARGSGAGGSAIARTQGIWTNAASMSLLINTGAGNSTITVPPQQGIYLGSIYIDSTPGQVSCFTSWGQSRKWGVWNAYNRVPIQIQAGDTTSYSYVTNTWRVARANAGNSVTTFCGLQEEPFTFATSGFVGSSLTTNQSTGGAVGIGYNSTSSPSGMTGEMNFTNSTASTIVINDSIVGSYLAPPDIGINLISALENGEGVTVNTWSGGQQFQVLSAKWRG